MGVSDRLVDNLLGVFIFATVGAVLVPLVLTSFANLSTSGLALASLFGTVLGILLAVNMFKGVQKQLKI